MSENYNHSFKWSWESVLLAFSRTKSVQQIMAEIEPEMDHDSPVSQMSQPLSQVYPNTSNPKDGLKKCLSRWDVVAYGVGSTVGAGIFVITGQGALAAGPAIVVSFAIASICCLFSAFAYAEFAARVPVSGSAYTFSYVCLGEMAAWFVGWNLTLEYAISAAAVARGWSSNLILFFNQCGWNAPEWLDQGNAGFTHVSMLALFICLVCMMILLWGVKESSTVNKIITVMNISVILFIIVLGSFHIHQSNWIQSIPDGTTIPSGCSGNGGFFPCGFNGILTGAAKIFFNYIGFDSVTTLAEEVVDPRKDIPIGVISTLGIATSLYIGASLVVTGMVPWYLLDHDTPLASAFKTVGLSWATTIIALITVTALTASTLCSLFAQPRIFYRMSKDGLLFQFFEIVHPKTKAPTWGTLITGIIAGLIAFSMDLDALSDMISIGTLMAFSTVCAGIVVLRIDAKDNPRKPVFLLAAFLVSCIGLCVALRNYSSVPIYAFVLLACLVLVPTLWLGRLPHVTTKINSACPFVPYLPLMGIFSNLYLICSLNVVSYIRIVVWTFVGFGIYFGYGITHSKMWRHSDGFGDVDSIRKESDGIGSQTHQSSSRHDDAQNALLKDVVIDENDDDMQDRDNIIMNEREDRTATISEKTHVQGSINGQ